MAAAASAVSQTVPLLLYLKAIGHAAGVGLLAAAALAAGCAPAPPCTATLLGPPRAAPDSERLLALRCSAAGGSGWESSFKGELDTAVRA